MLQYLMQTFNYSLKNEHLQDVIPFETFLNKKNILVQIFCGQGHTILQNSIQTICKKLPHAICIGTTTDGEIENKNITTLHTIVTISTFEHTTLKATCVNSSNSFDNGFNLAQQLIQHDTQLLILLADGTTTNGEDFLKGIETYSPHTVICGGMAGDNGQFSQTYIAYQESILEQGAVGVSLNSTQLKVHNDYRFNWSPIGIQHKIESVQNNRVYNIGGMTPVAFYAKYLGEQIASALPATGIEFPLIIEKQGICTARAVIAKHDDGSLSFAGNLEEGNWVKLGFGNAEMILQDPLGNIEELQAMQPESFFLYSCMARRRYMPNFIQVEVEPFANIAPTAGFFTYAEFFHNTQGNQLLNQTLTIVALSEQDEKKTAPTILEHTHQISEYAQTIQALTHLIQQSNKDYDKQTQKLNEQKEYSHQLLTSQKQFLRYAVHETNTPLSIIMANIELYELVHGKDKYISNIEVAMKNLSSIYDDLSYLIKKDQLDYHTQTLDLIDYTRSRVEFFSQVALKAKCRLLVIAKVHPATVCISETKLQRIIDNNITNAIKYSFENADILITIKEDITHYILEITSHSTTIQEPNKIFEEYYREERLKEGFGLGLNLVKKICDEENITIQVESKEEYTTFGYYFKKDAHENSAS